jgi:hypothetical protein
MRKLSVSLAALAVLTTAALTPPASASDVSSTHAYILANYALAKSGVAHVGVEQAKVHALNASLAQSCPGAGKGAPQLEVTQPLSAEVVVALWSAAYGAEAGPIHAFVAASHHWHWSSSKITRDATRYAKGLGEMASLPTPDLCKDVRAFAASGFKTLPPSVEPLVTRVEAISLDPVPVHLLAPFERGSDARVLAKTASLEHMLEGNEFALGQTDWLEVLETLGLPQ